MCELCGKVFTTHRSMECHVKTLHLHKTEEVFCDRCGRGFGHKLALRKHRYSSCDISDWKCSLCTKIFGTKQRLKSHLMSHCDAKPYVCNICSYRLVLW